eukprot:Rhum_TRINITY_DN14550_c1_g1::Rhum_TRINITY_DN14550_c1_g1_i1::g.97109::m.97109
MLHSDRPPRVRLLELDNGRSGRLRQVVFDHGPLPQVEPLVPVPRRHLHPHVCPERRQRRLVLQVRHVEHKRALPRLVLRPLPHLCLLLRLHPVQLPHRRVWLQRRHHLLALQRRVHHLLVPHAASRSVAVPPRTHQLQLQKWVRRRHGAHAGSRVVAGVAVVGVGVAAACRRRRAVAVAFAAGGAVCTACLVVGAQGASLLDGAFVVETGEHPHGDAPQRHDQQAAECGDDDVLDDVAHVRHGGVPDSAQGNQETAQKHVVCDRQRHHVREKAAAPRALVHHGRKEQQVHEDGRREHRRTLPRRATCGGRYAQKAGNDAVPCGVVRGEVGTGRAVGGQEHAPTLLEEGVRGVLAAPEVCGDRCEEESVAALLVERCVSVEGPRHNAPCVDRLAVKTLHAVHVVRVPHHPSLLLQVLQRPVVVVAHELHGKVPLEEDENAHNRRHTKQRNRNHPQEHLRRLPAPRRHADPHVAHRHQKQQPQEYRGGGEEQGGVGLATDGHRVVRILLTSPLPLLLLLLHRP